MQTLLLSLHLGDDFGHNNLATNVLFRGKKYASFRNNR